MTDGEHRRLLFYALIGHCITAWSTIHACLFALCHRSLRTSAKKAAIVYYRVPQLDTRIDLVDLLLTVELDARKRDKIALQREWKNIYNETKACLPFRNQVAHNGVVHQMQLGPTAVTDNGVPIYTPTPGQSGIFIEIATTKLLRRKLDNKGIPVANPLDKINGQELSDHHNRVQELGRKYALFDQKLFRRIAKNPFKHTKDKRPLAERTET